jgi:hypothetical protein
VDVGVHFGAAIFQGATNILKIFEDSSAVTGQGSVRGIRKARADARGILVQDKYREDVAKNHSDQDQADAAKEEESARAERSKRIAPFEWHFQFVRA